MLVTSETLHTIRQAADRERLLSTARRLIDIPSPTCDAGAVADALAAMLTDEGFDVERPAGGSAKAPAVAVRFDSGQPGRTLQFNGHLDTVHLPFTASAVDGDRLTGSGASDMKAGVAAMVEGLRILRDTKALSGGGILLTAHDLHEAPWGDCSQLNQLIDDGFAGDGVLIPEYTHDQLPVIGRGNAQIQMTVSRPGAPVHEVFRPREEPNVLDVGAKLAQRIVEWNTELEQHSHPLAGGESAFLGMLQCGEIYNQSPQTCELQGTLRWLPGHAWEEVRRDYQALVQQVAEQSGAKIDAEFMLIRDAFELDAESDLAETFQTVYSDVTGTKLPIGAKPFADDGSCFWQKKKIPAITHGPEAGGAHTTDEWVSIDDLVRVAVVYAATAVGFCGWHWRTSQSCRRLLLLGVGWFRLRRCGECVWLRLVLVMGLFFKYKPRSVMLVFCCWSHWRPCLFAICAASFSLMCQQFFIRLSRKILNRPFHRSAASACDRS